MTRAQEITGSELDPQIMTTTADASSSGNSGCDHNANANTKHAEDTNGVEDDGGEQARESPQTDFKSKETAAVLSFLFVIVLQCHGVG